MSLEYLRKNREYTTFDKLSLELFKSSHEYKYYNFGIAMVLSSFYKVFKNYKYKDIPKDELIKAIKFSADDNEVVHDYFYKLIEDEAEK